MSLTADLPTLLSRISYKANSGMRWREDHGDVHVKIWMWVPDSQDDRLSDKVIKVQKEFSFCSLAFADDYEFYRFMLATFVELETHEAREMFTVDGVPIVNDHYNDGTGDALTSIELPIAALDRSDREFKHRKRWQRAERRHREKHEWKVAMVKSEAAREVSR